MFDKSQSDLYTQYTFRPAVFLREKPRVVWDVSNELHSLHYIRQVSVSSRLEFAPSVTSRWGGRGGDGGGEGQISVWRLRRITVSSIQLIIITLFMAPHLIRAQSAYKDIRIHSLHHTHTHTHTHIHTHTDACAHTPRHTHTHTLQIHAFLPVPWCLPPVLTCALLSLSPVSQTWPALSPLKKRPKWRREKHQTHTANKNILRGKENGSEIPLNITSTQNMVEPPWGQRAGTIQQGGFLKINLRAPALASQLTCWHQWEHHGYIKTVLCSCVVMWGSSSAMTSSLLFHHPDIIVTVDWV